MSNEELFEDLDLRINEIRKEEYERGYTAANKEKSQDPLGWENLNFSITGDANVDPKRAEEYKKQRIERGFDDTELWNLDSTILKFVLPRLKRFKECTIGYPSSFNTYEEWIACLEKMINSIEAILEDSHEEADFEGFELFKEHFFHLWW